MNCRNFRPWNASACPTMPPGGTTASGSLRWRPIVQDIRRDGILAKHPLRRLSPELAQADRPLELVTGVLQAAEETLRSGGGEPGAVRSAARAVADAGDGPLAGGLRQAGSARRAGRENGPAWTPTSPRCPAVRQGRTAISTPARGAGRGPAGNRGLAQETPRRGSARRRRAGEGVRAEPLAVAAARVVAIAANSERLLRLPLARRPPAMVAGARRTPGKNTRSWTSWTGNGRRSPSSSGSTATSMARSPTSSSCVSDPRPGPVARPDSRRLGEGRQGPADRRQDRRIRRAARARWPTN